MRSNADYKATTENAAGQAWRFMTQKPPRSGFVRPPQHTGNGAAMMKVVPDVVARPGDVVALAPNILSVRHWDRLLGGALYAAAPRVDWANLLRRSFDVDVMACAKCGGPLRVLAVITERDPVRRILGHLGLPTEAPPLARARDPTDDLDEYEPGGQLEFGMA